MASKVCIYCSSPIGQKHEGFCLTIMEGDKEEYRVLTTEPDKE